MTHNFVILDKRLGQISSEISRLHGVSILVDLNQMLNDEDASFDKLPEQYRNIVLSIEKRKKKRLTKRQKLKQEASILKTMIDGKWYRPLDLGGSDKSYHSKTLIRLCRKGLVEYRQRQTKAKDLSHSSRGSKEYCLTDTGVVERNLINSQ